MASRHCGILQGRGRVEEEKTAINPFVAQNCSEMKSVVIFQKKKGTCPHTGFEPRTNAFLRRSLYHPSSTRVNQFTAHGLNMSNPLCRMRYSVHVLRTLNPCGKATASVRHWSRVHVPDQREFLLNRKVFFARNPYGFPSSFELQMDV